MISSLDDILQSRSIHELRELVVQLDKEGQSKQTELQQMVGSTYHDFIQSADTIAVMKTKSVQMENHLAIFGQLAQDIVAQTKSLMATADDVSAMVSMVPKSGAVACGKGAFHSGSIWEAELSSSLVWTCLDNCDIYTASQVVICAEAISNIANPSAHHPDPQPPSNLPSSPEKPLQDFMAMYVRRNAMNLLVAMERESVVSDVVWECGRVGFLKETVVDDGKLLFLYGAPNCQEIANAMAGLTALHLCCHISNATTTPTSFTGAAACGSDGNEDGKGVLNRSMVGSAPGGANGGAESMLMAYLRGVELTLQGLLDELNTVRSGDVGAAAGCDGPQSEAVLPQTIEKLIGTITEAVHLLQRTIINVYNIFFNHFHSTSQQRQQQSGGNHTYYSSKIDKNQVQNSKSSTAAHYVLPGLFGQALQNILESLIRGNHATTVTASTSGESSATEHRHFSNTLPNEWMSKQRELLLRIFQESSVLAIWKDWILNWTAAIQQACVLAFSHMKSAMEIAHIQRLTLHECMHCHETSTVDAVSPLAESADGGAISGSGTSSGYMSASPSSLSVWNEACLLLLPSNAITSTLAAFRNQSRNFETDHESSDTNNVGGVLIWSVVFRKPFITQVEHLLKVSYHNVFVRTRRKLLRALVAVGNSTLTSCCSDDIPTLHSHTGQETYISRPCGPLTIHPVTLDVEFVTGSCSDGRKGDGTNGSIACDMKQQQTPVGDGSGVCGEDWKWLQAYGSNVHFDFPQSSSYHTHSSTEGADVRAVNSSEVFLYAERMRLFLEIEISCLVKELLTPSDNQEKTMHLNDPESTYTLTRALQVQSCELIGQILVLLRNLATKFCKQLRQTMKDGSDGRASATHVYHHDTEASLRNRRVCMQNCILLVNRISWLLLSPSGHFLIDALEVSPQTIKLSMPAANSSSSAYYSTNGGSGSSSCQYMTTIDQLQSAFDIADLDGDGLLSLDEAIEAVLALWISPNTSSTAATDDDTNSAGGPASIDFLWSDVNMSAAQYSQAISSLAAPSAGADCGGVNRDLGVPMGLNYTIEEFRLLCAQMVQPPLSGRSGGGTSSRVGNSDSASGDAENGDTSTSPARCMSTCLSNLLMMTVSAWRESIAHDMTASVHSSLQRDFPVHMILPPEGMACTRGGREFLCRPGFKRWWCQREVDLGDDDDGGGSSGVEQLDVPSAPSSTVHASLRAACKIFHTSFLSADTSYMVPSLLSEGTGTDGDGSGIRRNELVCLADLARKWVYGDTLRILLTSLTAHHCEISATISNASSSTSTATVGGVPIIGDRSDGGGSVVQRQKMESVRSKVAALFEDYCLQILFDLQLCETTLQDPSDVDMASLIEQCRLQHSESVDPINTHLLLPLIRGELSCFVKSAHLLLPFVTRTDDLNQTEEGPDNISYPPTTETALKTAATTPLTSSRGDFDKRMRNLFATPSPSMITTTAAGPTTVAPGSGNGSSGVTNKTLPTTRFLLLPLPISFSESSSSSTHQRLQSSSDFPHNATASTTAGADHSLGSKSAILSGSGAYGRSGSSAAGGLSSVFKGFKGWAA